MIKNVEAVILGSGRRGDLATPKGFAPISQSRTFVMYPSGHCPSRTVAYNPDVTAREIIEEIKRLGPDEQKGIIRFAYQLDARRQLTGDELSSLAERMVNTADPSEQARIRDQIIRGFYGQKKNA